MELPIQFKHYTLVKGEVPSSKVGEYAFDGYRLIDKLGVQVVAGTSLGALIAHGQQADVTMEIAQQFVERKLAAFAHLDGVDIDAAPEQPAGLMVPPGYMPPQRH